VGEIVETSSHEACLTDGVVAFSKLEAILSAMNDQSSWKLGEQLAEARHISKELKNKRESMFD